MHVDDPPAELVPLAQAVQLDAPAEELLPGWHGVHTGEFAGAKEPAEHSSHDVLIAEKLPAVHWVQVDSPNRTRLPEGHCMQDTGDT